MQKTATSGKARAAKRPKKDASLSRKEPDSSNGGGGGKSSSIYKGVTRHRRTGLFEAHLYLGAYDTEEAAARAYDLAALKYWGPETILNFSTVLPEVATSAGASSSRQVPADGVAALPRKSPPASVASSAGCTPYAVAPAARPNVPVDFDVFSSKRRTLLADAGPSTKRPPKVPPLADDEVPKFECGFCLETVDQLDLFHDGLCEACITTIIEDTLRKGDQDIQCADPACKDILHPKNCKDLINKDLINKGPDAEILELPCETKILELYLEDLDRKFREGDLDIQCRNPACKDILHPKNCKDLINKGPDAELVRKLAQDRKWKQCPKCKMTVEKFDGCRRTTCSRCHLVFCYQCGLPILRSQVEEGGEVCRCNDTGLAFDANDANMDHPLDADMPQQDDGHLDADGNRDMDT